MRVGGVFRPEDHPAGADDARVSALFDALFPGDPAPAFDAAHAGLAIVARNPGAALHLARLSRALMLESGWTARPVLRELAIACVNARYRSAFSLRARNAAIRAAGIGEARIAALSDDDPGDLFDAEQRLVIDYVRAVLAADVPDALFDRVSAAYGETEAAELTTIVGVWAAWAMIVEAMGVA